MELDRYFTRFNTVRVQIFAVQLAGLVETSNFEIAGTDENSLAPILMTAGEASSGKITTVDQRSYFEPDPTRLESEVKVFLAQFSRTPGVTQATRLSPDIDLTIYPSMKVTAGTPSGTSFPQHIPLTTTGFLSPTMRYWLEMPGSSYYGTLPSVLQPFSILANPIPAMSFFSIATATTLNTTQVSFPIAFFNPTTTTEDDTTTTTTIRPTDLLQFPSTTSFSGLDMTHILSNLYSLQVGLTEVALVIYEADSATGTTNNNGEEIPRTEVISLRVALTPLGLEPSREFKGHLGGIITTIIAIVMSVLGLIIVIVVFCCVKKCIQKRNQMKLEKLRLLQMEYLNNHLTIVGNMAVEAGLEAPPTTVEEMQKKEKEAKEKKKMDKKKVKIATTPPKVANPESSPSAPSPIPSQQSKSINTKRARRTEKMVEVMVEETDEDDSGSDDGGDEGSPSSKPIEA